MGGNSSVRRTCTRCRAIFRGDVGHCSRDGAPLVPATGDPLLGQTLGGGRYLIVRFVGEGSAGRVYEADDLRANRRCAIKVLFGELAAVPDVRQRFRREADAAGRLDHPNVASVLAASLDTAGDPLYIVMALISGPTLAAVVKSQGAPPEARARSILRGVTSGLAHAHEQGVLHRDLKPDNILLMRANDEPCLVDFGVSKLLVTRAQPKLTSYGRVIGTPGFIAPEVLRGLPADHRSDLYGLGVTAFFTLTGRFPFADDEVSSISETLAGVDVSPLDDALVSRGLRDWVRGLLAADPALRPADAGSALCALDDERNVIDLRGGGRPAQTPETPAHAPGEGAGGTSRLGFVAAWLAVALVVVGGALWANADYGSTGRPVAVRAPARPSAPPPPARGVGDAGVVGGPGSERAVSAPTNRASVRRAAGAAPPHRHKRASASPASPAPSSSARREDAAIRAPPGRVDAQGARGAPGRARATRSDARARDDRPRGVAYAARPRRAGGNRRPTAERLREAYTALGRRLQALTDSPGVEALHRRYFDLPIADALRRPERVEAVFRRVKRLSADVAAVERQGTSPFSP